MFSIDKIEHADLTYLSNARQIGLLNEVMKVIKDVETALNDNLPIDMLAIDLKGYLNCWVI